MSLQNEVLVGVDQLLLLLSAPKHYESNYKITTLKGESCWCLGKIGGQLLRQLATSIVTMRMAVYKQVGVVTERLVEAMSVTTYVVFHQMERSNGI